jgi:hydrogenase maturation protease HycI
MDNPFEKIIKGKVVFFGVGNMLRSDDAVGPLLVDRLRGKVNAVCVNAENAPEKFLGKIIKLAPDTLLIIDAVHLGLGPGEYRIVKPEDLEGVGFSTHDIPLKSLVDYIKAEIDTDIYLLGIQPAHLAIGEGLSESVKKTIQTLEILIREAMN